MALLSHCSRRRASQAADAATTVLLALTFIVFNIMVAGASLSLRVRAGSFAYLGLVGILASLLFSGRLAIEPFAKAEAEEEEAKAGAEEWAEVEADVEAKAEATASSV